MSHFGYHVCGSVESVSSRGRSATMWLAALAAVALVAMPAQSAVIVSTATSASFASNANNAGVVAAWGGNPILPGNLAQAGTITLLSGGYPFGGNVANLIDGLMVSSVNPTGGPYSVEDTENSANFSDGSQVRLVLDGTYDIARIDTFTAYQWTRTGQKWSIYTSSNGGASWSATPLASANQTNVDPGANVFYSRSVTVQDSVPGTAIATGVNALRFDISNTDPAGGGFSPAVFNEFAVYAVPEPATIASLLGGVGSLLLLRRRRTR